MPKPDLHNEGNDEVKHFESLAYQEEITRRLMAAAEARELMRGSLDTMQELITAENDEEVRYYESPKYHAEIYKKLQHANISGLLQHPNPSSTGRTPTTTIRLDPDDIKLARRIANSKGIRYQTYLKMIIREALKKDLLALVQELGP